MDTTMWLVALNTVVGLGILIMAIHDRRVEKKYFGDLLEELEDD